VRRLILLCISLALLGGCGGTTAAVAPQIALPVARDIARGSAARSWMAPQAQSGDLVYVSDQNGNVDVYSYPGGQRVGALTGFYSPAGLCSDSAGHVFVANTIGEDVIEFAHGKKKELAKLSDFAYYPESCAVDATTGNLAVTNYTTASQAPGGVAIYAGAKGYATSYSDPNIAIYYFCGYDDKGNLFVDGEAAGTSGTEFAVLPKGSSTFTDITLDRTIGFPGAVQWDGKYVAIEDTSKDVIYRLKISGSKATTVQTIHFQSQHADLVVQFWIAGSSIIMPYGSVYRKQHNVGFWPYPAGGKPTKIVHVPGSTELYGVTLSVAK
jgi:hypothetical protein